MSAPIKHPGQAFIGIDQHYSYNTEAKITAFVSKVVTIWAKTHMCFRPILRMPPPLTPQGEKIVPVPEKSFIQKYWLYGAVVIGAMCKSLFYEIDLSANEGLILL